MKLSKDLEKEKFIQEVEEYSEYIKEDKEFQDEIKFLTK